MYVCQYWLGRRTHVICVYGRRVEQKVSKDLEHRINPLCVAVMYAGHALNV